MKRGGVEERVLLGGRFAGYTDGDRGKFSGSNNVSSLPADVEIRVDECVKNGGFESQAEVLRAAMDALEKDERFKFSEFLRKNQLAEQQSQNGESIELDEEDLYRRLRERFEARH
jgi:Predicted transcriptional regulators containing the CopG/Arc/MetJ DNA-binding domain